MSKMSNMSEQKIVQIGLSGLVDSWPMIKTWNSLPNDILFEIGLAIIESESHENCGKLVYLSREIDERIDEILGYDESLYYTRTGSGYVYDDCLHAQYGELDSIMTID